MRVKGPLWRELESITAQLRHYYFLTQQRPLPGDIAIVSQQIKRLEYILRGFELGE